MASSPIEIPKTIAFNTKTGDWNTRYSFLPDCYSFLNKMFLSARTTATSFISWVHNSDRVPRTSYYGVSRGSSIAVAFNDNVSNNKIYKSFSLEGTSNIRGANTFTVNSDNSPNKNFSIGVIKDKGGILYGHIGQSTSMLSGGNLELVGVIENIQYAVGASFMRVRMASGTENDLNPSSQNSLYILGNILSNGQITFRTFFSQPLESEINSNFVQFTQNDLQGVGQNFSPQSVQRNDGFLEKLLTLPDFTGFVGINPPPNTLLLFEVNPSSMFGDSPRGQYAEAVVSLGSNPYELYSLNVDYEPTNLDHSGQ